MQIPFDASDVEFWMLDNDYCGARSHQIVVQEGDLVDWLVIDSDINEF